MPTIKSTERKLHNFVKDGLTYKTDIEQLKKNIELALSKVIVSYQEAGFDKLNAFCGDSGSISITAYREDLFIDTAIHSEEDIDFEFSTTNGYELIDDADEKHFGITIEKACELIKNIAKAAK